MSTDALIHEYLWLVHYLANKEFSSYKNDEDLIQCGRIGLWQAAETWDGKRSFLPYARMCIMHDMLDYVRAEKNKREFSLEEEPEGTYEMEDVPRLRERIKAAWPPKSLDRKILLAILEGETKARIAAAYHMTTAQVTAIARRAWQRLEE